MENLIHIVITIRVFLFMKQLTFLKKLHFHVTYILYLFSIKHYITFHVLIFCTCFSFCLEQYNSNLNTSIIGFAGELTFPNVEVCFKKPAQLYALECP